MFNKSSGPMRESGKVATAGGATRSSRTGWNSWVVAAAGCIREGFPEVPFPRPCANAGSTTMNIASQTIARNIKDVSRNRFMLTTPQPALNKI
jgi:hypothetical protein